VVDWEEPDPSNDTQPIVPPPALTQRLGVQPPAGGPILVHIGEIQVSADAVYTPTGSFPVRGSQWYAQDQWSMTQKIPTWAVVCAIVGFCVVTVFSLFFLLAKETVV
jgi:hypothetical protein